MDCRLPTRCLAFAAIVFVPLVHFAPPARAGSPDAFWWDEFALPPAGQGLAPAVSGGLTVFDFVLYENKLVAGGLFSAAGDQTTVGNIASWDGQLWTKHGTGCNDYVAALAVHGADLIVGGRFTVAGGNAANRIASWNPNRTPPRWLPFGSGLQGGSSPEVWDVVSHAGEVYAGGSFTLSGATPVKGLGRWNGASWSEVGGGVTRASGTAVVHALKTFNGQLVVGGFFDHAGPVPATNVALWNGASFSPMGTGLGGAFNDVNNFTLHQGELYACGGFSVAGGACPGVARWDGVTWQPLGTGVAGGQAYVWSLHSFGGYLYAAGSFTTAGGQPALNIARWDGANWTGLGSGSTAFQCQGLGDFAGDLYVGINGNTVGGKPSYGVGRWMAPGIFAGIDTMPLGNPGNGTGVLWFDFDSNGLDDLYLANWAGESNVLLRNEGDCNFADVTPPTLALTAAASAAVAAADYDKDGDLDLYVANADAATGDKLFRNNGGTFVDSGLLGDVGQAAAATWVDVNSDGFPDLWLAQGSDGGEANRLYRNDAGAGFTFLDAVINGDAWAGGAAWGDFDNDGDPDLYQAGQGAAQPNRLFRNDGGWTFADVTPAVLADTGAGRGVTWGDFDNDADLDLALANDFGDPDHLFRNDGAGAFADVTPAALAGPSQSRGIAWADFDHDADLDLYVCRNGADLLLRNDAGSWTNASTDAATNSTGCAWGDADGDGDLDLYQVNWGEPNRLLKNTIYLGSPIAYDSPVLATDLRSTGPGHWVRFDLVGSNAGVVGARVRIVAGGITQIREVSGGSGYGSQDSPRVEFGLGSASTIDSVTVRWSSGLTQTLTNRAADQTHTITAPAGWVNVTTPVLSNPVSSGGLAWTDYDDDGDPDLFRMQLSPSPGNALSRNDGGSSFVDVTPAALLGTGMSGGVTWGDYDNDGDPDSYIAQAGNPNLLVRNDGALGFTDVSAPPTNPIDYGYGATWVDFDLDGDLDLHATHVGNRLFRNDSSGFTDVTPAGLDIPLTGTFGAWGDYDNDGDSDVFLGGDPDAAAGGNGRLVRNDGGEAFTNATPASFSILKTPIGASWGDYDNDGDLDLFVTEPFGVGTHNRLFRNEGAGAFSSVSFPSNPVYGYGSTWFDRDNDGDLDLAVVSLATARVYRNDGGTFMSEGDASLLSLGNARCMTAADYNLDGAVDLFLGGTSGRLLKNVPDVSNRWLHLDLVGSTGNRSAIGARVRVVTGSVSQIREVEGSSGYLSQNSLTLEFGVGPAAIADSVIVRWPSTSGGFRSNPVTILTNVAANQRLLVEEDGGASGLAVAVIPSRFALHPSFPNPFDRETTIRFDLARQGWARLEVFDVSGRRVRTLENGVRDAGRQSIRWDGRDESGQGAAAGVYFYRLECAEGTTTRKLLRMR